MIQLTISTSPVVGLENLVRKLSVHSYTEDFTAKTFTIPYTIQHFNINDEFVGIPDLYNVLIASNETILHVNKTTFVPEAESENTNPIGQYDYFKILQKQVNNELIITQQIQSLNSRGYFNT